MNEYKVECSTEYFPLDYRKNCKANVSLSFNSQILRGKRLSRLHRKVENSKCAYSRVSAFPLDACDSCMYGDELLCSPHVGVMFSLACAYSFHCSTLYERP